jgi:transcriptional regulator GlxA family with amidase domain
VHAPTPRRIELLAFPDVQMLDIAGPAQVFTAANERAAERQAPSPYAIEVVAPAGTQVRSTSGLAFLTAPLPAHDAPLHTLIVAGGKGVTQAARDDALRAWVKQRAQSAERVASVCTGAFMLAASGLLDGRRAVTHWRHCELLARNYPQVRVDRDPIFVQDGSVWTSAGVTAGIDLALELVKADLGRTAALDVARGLVVFLKRPGGQAQFSAALSLQSADDRFAALHDWLAGHLDEDLSLARLALAAGMSERTFQRRYREATGMTPARAIETMRVEAARQMLAETALPLKRIAIKCGFGSEETLRRCFVKAQGVTPMAYRERFGEGFAEDLREGAGRASASPRR